MLFGASALVLVVFVTGLNSWTVYRQWQDNNDTNAHAAVVHVDDNINADFERRLDSLSQTSLHILNVQDETHVQHSLDMLRGIHPDYSWVSLTDAQGQITASTNRQVLGANVGQQTWFRSIKRTPNTQTDDNHGLITSRLINEAQIAFDFSVPIYDVKGRFVGAIVAELLSDQFQALIDRTVALEPNQSFDALLIDGNGMILNGAADFIGHRIELDFGSAADSAVFDYIKARTSDGKQHMAVALLPNPSHLLGRMDWRTILLLHDSALTMPLDQISSTLAAGGGLGLLFVALCYGLATWVIAPFVDVIKSADKFREGGSNGNGERRLAIVNGSPYSEVAMLSSSINTLMSGLTAKEDELRVLNDTLNHKVKERTLELVLIADSLQNEIAQRKQLQQQHEQLMAELLALASTDSLTKAFNRRTLYQLGEEEFNRSRRMNMPISVIMLDIDRFKHINDSFGHAAGDEILEKVAEQFRGVVRESDIIGRYGGEEFVFVLPGTDEEGALLVAERLRKSVVEAGHQTTIADRWQITASLGVAALHNTTFDFAALVRRADDATYDAKHAGRNRIAIAP